MAGSGQVWPDMAGSRHVLTGYGQLTDVSAMFDTPTICIHILLPNLESLLCLPLVLVDAINNVGSKSSSTRFDASHGQQPSGRDMAWVSPCLGRIGQKVWAEYDG
ncbi:hypothetical protein Tco_1239718, partial [Tanacetum coccineum]